MLDGSRLDDLAAYVRQALGLGDDAAALQSLLWEEPRSLLFDVIPTLVRQLNHEWQRVVDGKPQPWSDTIGGAPMPDFVPPTLFGDLNVPELLLRIPDTPPAVPASGRRYGRRGGHAVAPQLSGEPTAVAPEFREDQYLPLAQGLVEFAPGHVNKRFAAKERTDEAHWLALPDEAQLSRGVLPLQYLSLVKDDVPIVIPDGGTMYHVYRPRAYTLAVVPPDVKNTSSARLSWRSHFAPRNTAGSLTVEDGVGVALELPSASPLGRFIERIDYYTQATGAWVDVTRFAIGVEVETRYAGGTEVRRRLRFEEDGQPAALGFQSAVDALAVRFASPSPDEITSSTAWPALHTHLGPEYFLYRLRHDRRLDEAGLSTFEIGWLWQIELSTLVAVAVARDCDLSDAAVIVDRARPQLADRTMAVIFQTQQVEEQADRDAVGRLHERLRSRLADPVVHAALREHEAALWDDSPQGLHDWLRECFAASLGAALFNALTRLVPDINPDDLLLDIDDGTIWLSEESAGGVGLISRIVQTLSEHPRAFDLQMQDTIQTCDRANIAAQLASVADLLAHDHTGLRDAFASIRAVDDLPTQEATRRALIRTLEDAGIPATRALVVALNAKLLRPNSGPDSDALIAALVRLWSEEARRIGCTIDVRVMVVAALQVPEIATMVTTVLQRIGGTATVDETQVFNLLQSLLWLTCHDSCPDCIETWQPYQETVRPSRALLNALLTPRATPLTYGEVGWREALARQLGTEYHAQILCEQDLLGACKRDLLDVSVTPIDADYQLFYPTVERVSRLGRQWTIDLVVGEMLPA